MAGSAWWMWPDAFRWFVIAEGIVLAGFAVAVMTEAKKFRAPPRHVVAVAISYVILIIVGIVEVYGRMDQDWTWRSFFTLAAFSFGLYSMRLMWTAYQYVERMERHDQKTVEAGNRLMAQAFDKEHGGK